METVHVENTWSTLNISQTHITRYRAQYVRQQCQVLSLIQREGKGGDHMKLPISSVKSLGTKKILNVCVAPSRCQDSWRRLGRKAKSLISLKTSTPIPSVVSVQHPLARLASCYRSKYMNGRPISEFASLQKATKKWLETWRAFWLPALISNNKIDYAPFNSSLQQLHKNQTQPSHTILVNMVTEAYRDQETDILGRHGTKNFTFEEFLHHVLWTHDFGFQDPHWISVYDLCEPCARRYDHVVHMEAAREEVRDLLHLVHPPSPVNITLHPIKLPDFHMYLSLPKLLLDKIIQLYWLDFHLFGYSEQFISESGRRVE
ncbi:hypothetical protein Pmani_026800 [Petrolisthes manimaculis]|uniref:Carbohydrate sulfotransferase n=1 Tax=Petrolisthes manimaculis TaxID=1843537 RepID=A0AAE1P2T4_9EUCA|nr:hypothetical protein Pmani_026800 [Petrolisthes manimaculis]